MNLISSEIKINQLTLIGTNLDLDLTAETVTLLLI